LHSSQVIIHPHTLSVNFTRKPRLDFTQGLHIGVVGAIGYAKGSEIVIEMAKLMQQDMPDATLTVIGSLQNAPSLKNLIITGPYKIHELPFLIEKYGINLCFISSIWPETFSYVTSELMQLDMPLCCFNLGAPAERIQNYNSGYVITEVDPVIALREIRSFFAMVSEQHRYTHGFLAGNEPSRAKKTC
jgi:glycosyltransferase involved in cell wall biosynthesis